MTLSIAVSASAAAWATVFLPVAMDCSMSWRICAFSTLLQPAAAGMNQLLSAAVAVALVASTDFSGASWVVLLGRLPLPIRTFWPAVPVKSLIHSAARSWAT